MLLEKCNSLLLHCTYPCGKYTRIGSGYVVTMLEIYAIGNECMKNTVLEIYVNGEGRVKSL